MLFVDKTFLSRLETHSVLDSLSPVGKIESESLFFLNRKSCLEKLVLITPLSILLLLST